MVLDALGTGGTERQMELMLGQWPREDQVEICALAAGGDAEARFRALVPVHVIPRRRRLDLGQARPLARLVGQQHVDVVLAAHRYAGLVVKLARVQGMRAPVVCSVRGRHAYSRVQRLLYDHVDLWMMKAAAAVITNSQRVAEDLRGRRSFRGRIEIVPNGIDPSRLVPHAQVDVRRQLGIVEGAAVVLCVGRMVEVKDPLRSIAVLDHVRKAGVDAHLIWVGDGPLTGAMAAAAQEHELSSWVHLVGAVDDPRDHYAAADVLLHPSRWENLSNTILEGMAAELPVVARDVGGNRELVEHEVNGLLDEDLEGATLRILLDGHTRSSMGQAGERRVHEEFSLRAAVARHHEILAHACEGAQ